VYERHDLQLRSGRGKLECSHFKPAKSPETKRPCVVYLHGNCSSRLEAFDALPVLLPRDLTVFCLDLSGSGRSDGEYISLGHHEEKDLGIVLQYLRTQENVGSIGLWGRSMGATTSILRAAEDHDLAACVLDSAFRDLRTVAEELVSRGRFPIPGFLVGWALELVRSEVATRAAFDPLELMPIKCAKLAVCPAFFGVASDDTFVLPHHTKDLHDAWKGERSLRVFDGGHNGVRPTWFLEEAADFLAERLRGRCASSGSQAVVRERCRTSNSSKGEEDDDEGNEDGNQAPRLVSPLTQRLDMDSGPEHGPENKALTEADVPRRKHAMATELLEIGYSTDVVILASRQCSTTEDAIMWLNKQPGEAFSNYESGPPAGRMAPTASEEGPRVHSSRSTHQPKCDRAKSAPPRPSPRSTSPPRASAPSRVVGPRVGPPGASLSQQLRYLGFNESECDTASKRCLTLEDAMEWLAASRVTVHL